MIHWLLAASLLSLTAHAAPAADSLLPVPGFGEVHLIDTGATRPSARLLIFISDEKGWTEQTAALARTVAGEGWTIAGVDLAQYEKTIAARTEGCVTPVVDFEALSQQVEKEAGLPSEPAPVLAGHGLGGELAYAVLAQAAPQQFSGAVSGAFCPLFSIGKPVCEVGELKLLVHGARRFLQPGKITAPWRVVQGVTDPLCKAAAIERFAKPIPNAQVTAVKGMTHELGKGTPAAEPMAEALRGLQIAPGKLPVAEPAPSVSPDGGTASPESPVSKAPASSATGGGTQAH